MNNTAPTGGVNKPIPQFNTSMIPYWIGSIPIDVAIGNKIGVVIRMIGAISIKHPRTNRIRFSKIAITYGLLDTPRIKFAARSGTCKVVKQ